MIFAELRMVGEAAEEARTALSSMEERHSGVAYRPSIGLVVDGDPQLRERLVRIAGGSVHPSQGWVRELIGGLFKRKS